MADHIDPVFELCSAKIEIEHLERDLSIALHLLFAVLLWLLEIASPELSQSLRHFVHAKIIQLPQGCRLGRRLIELDDQFGGRLESHGIWLKHWIYEPRETSNGR
jgi:hypothetical protein